MDPQPRPHAHAAGLTAARTLRPAGIKAPPAPTFADVGRACHRWLLKHDLGYRATSDAQHARNQRVAAGTELSDA